MHNNHLFMLIQSFGPKESRAARKYLHSPFFNTRKDLLDLFDALRKNMTDRQKIWKSIYPNTHFDEQKFRLLCSYLFKQLETFIAISAYLKDPLNVSLETSTELRKRGLNKLYKRSSKSLEKKLDQQNQRDTQYYERQYILGWENYQIATIENPTAKQPLELAAEMADIAYLSRRLQLICLQKAQSSVYQTINAAHKREQHILDMAQHENFIDLPAIAIYLACYKMLENPSNEQAFKKFKTLLIAHGPAFQHEETRGLYLLAVNYCVKRINNGDRNYSKEVLDLYKPGLEAEYLFEDGLLSRFTYHNIVAAGIQSQELDWVEQFIHQHKNNLERKYRDSSFSFNLARLEYARSKYDQVLGLLQKANYRDPLLNLAAKTLLLKTYYEQDEIDLLQSHLAAMENYIRRKRVIGYHRKNYQNIVRYAERLLKLNFFNKTEVQKLSQAIQVEQNLTEKEWFLKQLE